MYALNFKIMAWVLFLFSTWLVSVVWVNRDSRRNNLRFEGWNTLTCILGLLGALIYASYRYQMRKVVVQSNLPQEETDQKDVVFPSTVTAELPELQLFRKDGEPVRLTRSRRRREKQVSAIDEVKNMIARALDERATDIHLESMEQELRIRYRVDGILHTIKEYPRDLGRSVISALKVMGGIDIAEKRRAQDGSFMASYQGRTIDFRVASSSSLHGETLVIRVLDREYGLVPLHKLGFSASMFSAVQDIIKYSHGMILVVGPTGSGKTTTLYALLRQLNAVEKNIITIEDPVEYKLPGITQISVNPKAGVTFANGLRSILRQDPDILMIGEIRDFETAEMATQAALTGHLVFSTLHANDAVSAVARLRNMRVEGAMIAASLIAVIAQRLIRNLCSVCKAPIVETEKTSGSRVGAVGCDECRKTGYQGRTGIFELLLLNDKLKTLVEQGAETEAIRAVARESGLTTMREDGITKVHQGITTIDEVLRVSQ